MADLELPIMAPGASATSHAKALGCWARADDPPGWVHQSNSPWAGACGAEPATTDPRSSWRPGPMPRSAPSPDQGALFAPPSPPEAVRRAGDPHVYLPAEDRPTQAATAATVLPRTGTQRRRVLDAIRAAGRDGLTDEELEDALHLGGNSVRPRRKELEEAGLILDSSDRRQTSTGKAAIVWVAAGLDGEVARGA